MNRDAPLCPPKRNWLCIAYAFPPINRSGAHRTAAFVRGLASLGWQATVLTVAPPASEPLDPGLISGVPRETDIVAARWLQPITSIKRLLLNSFRTLGFAHRNCAPKTHTDAAPHAPRRLARDFADLLATPDSRTGWIIPAVWKGLRAIRRRRPEIIYSTSPYASAHLIALVLNRVTGIPWVADFRDPWCGNPFVQRRMRVVERLDAWLERRVLQNASKVICNTPTMARSLVASHPDIHPKVCTILNGIDTQLMHRPQRLVHPSDFLFLHCGQFYGPRSPAVLFEAFRRITIESPQAGQNTRLALVGPPVFRGVPLLQLATKAGLSEQVIVPGEVPHADALELSAAADALVLIGSAGPGSELQIPQKLFEYLALRRPILALLAHGNPAIAILQDAQADCFVCDPDDPAGIAQTMKLLMDPKRKASPQAWNGVHRFDRSLRIQELHDVFQALAQPYATASRFRVPDERARRNTTTASTSIIAASASRISATQATLLPPAP